MDFPINNKTGKFKSFTFIRAPSHITDGPRRPSVVMNNYPENQHSYERKSSASESKFSKRKRQIDISSDSIPRSIRLREFHYWLPKGYAQLKYFLVEAILKNKKFDAILLHVGVNDPLNDESQDSVQNFVDNLKQIGLKSAEVKRTLISRMVVNNKLTSAYISSANQRISNMCRDNSYVYIDNNNIPTSSLFRDDLHLLEIGKRILANNFKDNLSNFLRIRKTYRPLPTSTLISENPSETTNSCKRNIESDDECCNESHKELRQKNLNHPIIVQLKINSTRNKFQILEKEVCANLDILLIT